MNVRQREPRILLPKLRESARGQPCMFQGPTCNGNSDTVVWCHSDHSEHGKGMGMKSHDLWGFYGCSACHEYYEYELRGYPARREMFQEANRRSLEHAVRIGAIG